MTLLEEIIDSLRSSDIIIRKNATTRFSSIYGAKIRSYIREKYPNEETFSYVFDKSITLMIYAITQYDYSPREEELIKELKNIASLSNYETQLFEEKRMLLYQQKNDYTLIEQKLRKRSNSFLTVLTQYYIDAYHAVSPHDKLVKDAINQCTFSHYILGIWNNQRLHDRGSVSRLASFSSDISLLFALRYSNNDLIRNKAFLAIERHCRMRFALNKEANQEVLAESMTIFFEKIQEPTFFLHSSLGSYFEGVMSNLLKKEYRINKQQKWDNKIISVSHPYFLEAELFEFVREGLDAIEHIHAGKARILLLTGRRTLFTKIVQAATLDQTPNNFGNHPDYSTKQSEAQQRQECKKALCEWMEKTVNDPESNWFGKRGKAMLNYISKKE